MVSVVGFVYGFRRRRKHFVYGFRRCFFNGFRRGRKTFVMVSVAGCLVDSAAAGGSISLECIERFLVFMFLGLVSVAGFCMVSVVAGKHCLYGFRRCFVMCLFLVSAVARNVFYGFRRWLFYGFRLLQDRGCLSDGNHKKNKNTKKKKTSGHFRDELSIYIYIYIYIHT